MLKTRSVRAGCQPTWRFTFSTNPLHTWTCLTKQFNCSHAGNTALSPAYPSARVIIVSWTTFVWEVKLREWHHDFRHSPHSKEWLTVYCVKIFPNTSSAVLILRWQRTSSQKTLIQLSKRIRLKGQGSERHKRDHIKMDLDHIYQHRNQPSGMLGSVGS